MSIESRSPAFNIVFIFNSGIVLFICNMESSCHFPPCAKQNDSNKMLRRDRACFVTYLFLTDSFSSRVLFSIHLRVDRVECVMFMAHLLGDTLLASSRHDDINFSRSLFSIFKSFCIVAVWLCLNATRALIIIFVALHKLHMLTHSRARTSRTTIVLLFRWVTTYNETGCVSLVPLSFVKTISKTWNKLPSIGKFRRVYHRIE